MSVARPKFAIASLSLGTCAHHTLPAKIFAASRLGYDGIEMFIPDFEQFVTEVRQGQHSALFPAGFAAGLIPQPALERFCADALSTLCTQHGLSIPILQPLRDFENFSSDAEIMRAVDSAERWLSLMPHLRTDLLLVCSNFVPGGTALQGAALDEYLRWQVRAFIALSVRAERYGVRVGYEPLAWGTVVDRWELVWRVVEQVNRPNVGIILDSFNQMGNQYADPSVPGGVRPAPAGALRANLAKLARTIPAHKLFFYQVADAARPLKTIESKPDAPARMTWSRASRLYPCEYSRGAFLPVREFTEAILATGYDGWWSLEVFNESLKEEDSGCVWRHGERGISGLRALWHTVGNVRELETPVEQSELARL